MQMDPWPTCQWLREEPYSGRDLIRLRDVPSMIARQDEQVAWRSCSATREAVDQIMKGRSRCAASIPGHQARQNQSAGNFFNIPVTSASNAVMPTGTERVSPRP